MAALSTESSTQETLQAAFIRAATWHGSLDEADALLEAHPELTGSSIHIAAILGDAATVQQFLQMDPGNAMATADPYKANALTCLCLSKYLRFGKRGSDDFLNAATFLLDAGADAGSGFWTEGRYPEYETPLYGAAGVAHHAALTRLLLSRGADPNDGEALYHSPETHDNEAMKALVETGRLTTDSLSMMLIRKHDWHDYDGVDYLLNHGANPDGIRSKGWCPLHHALLRDNHLSIIALLFDHGADPAIVSGGLTVMARAAREGRSDVLSLMDQRGLALPLVGIDRLIAACAMGDHGQVQAILKEEPALQEELHAMGGVLLAKFSGTGNEDGVRQLLDAGIKSTAVFTEGDGYFDIPSESLPVHVAAWRMRPGIVKLLIDYGSPVDIKDANGRTPLALAVRACVDSYWTERCSPALVEILLVAGADVHHVAFPSGHGAVDQLLRQLPLK